MLQDISDHLVADREKPGHETAARKALVQNRSRSLLQRRSKRVLETHSYERVTKRVAGYFFNRSIEAQVMISPSLEQEQA